MKKYIITGISLAIVVLAFNFFTKPITPAQGSVTQGSSYDTVTTGPNAGNTNTKQFFEISTTTSGGTLGSIIISTSTAGIYTIYDATTSNVSLRAGATTTLKILAQILFGTPPGTYTYDSKFYYGLVLDATGAALVPTTTITWRSY